MYATTINLFTLAMLQLRTHKRKTMGDKTLYINIPQQLVHVACNREKIAEAFTHKN
jgi:hypothetical protein